MEKLYIIKIGGNVIDRQEDLSAFLKDFAGIGGKKILVHGGGKLASELSRKLGIEPQMVNGRRITDAETLKIATMVYGGLVNKQIVAGLQALGCNALGLTGADAGCIPARKRAVEEVDYGYVGDVDTVAINTLSLNAFLNAGLTPVMAPLTHDRLGSLLNTNADTIAASLAAALAPHYEVELVYCFERTGVLMDKDDDNSYIPQIDPQLYAQLKAAGKITDGMIPKLDNAFGSLEQGVNTVSIIHAKAISYIDSTEPLPGTRLIKQNIYAAGEHTA